MRGLAYSTLACPAWSLERALAAAREYGYAGVELRLIDGELIEPTLSAGERQRLGGLLAASGLQVVAVDSSIRLTAEAPVRQLAAELEWYLELASAWRAPLVRVFGGPGRTGQAVEVLNLAAPAAERAGLAIGLETHDAFSSSAAVAEVLAGVPSPAVGVVWDMVHTQRLGDRPAEVLQRLAGRVLNVHVKDARRRTPGGSWEAGFDYVALGEGEVSVRDALRLLRDSGYQGWLVAEWEKKWHPELAEPEVALPQYAEVLRSWLDGP